MAKKPRIELTDGQLDDLIAQLDGIEVDVEDLLSEGDDEEESGDGDTLSDPDAVSYCLDELYGFDLERVEAVLARSNAAREEMARLRREAGAWKGPAGERRVRALTRNILWRSMPLRMVLNRLKKAAAGGFGGLAEGLAANFRLAPGQAKHRMVAHAEVDDGLFRWEMVHEEQDSLNIRLASWAVGLRGATVRLEAGTWVAEGVLEAIGPGEVGAEVVVSAADRREMGQVPPQVRVSIVGAEGSAPQEALET